jgi:hypothetical protein
MKMKLEHFDYIAEKIGALDTPALRAAYRDAGLSLKRYQWDITYQVGLTSFICGALYPYLDDTHIQTALNRIIPSFDFEARP